MLWELDILADLAKNTRLFKEKRICSESKQYDGVRSINFDPNLTQENIIPDTQKISNSA